jgi:hypothetical protein
MFIIRITIVLGRPPPPCWEKIPNNPVKKLTAYLVNKKLPSYFISMEIKVRCEN